MENNRYFKLLCAAAGILFASIVIYNAVTAPDLFVTAVEYRSVSSKQDAASSLSAPSSSKEAVPESSEAPPESEAVSNPFSDAAASMEEVNTENSFVSDGSASSSSLIDINHASAQEMADALPGIGEVIAGRIVDYRNLNGAFRSLEELKNVKGIGDITFDKIKDLITVS